MMKRRLLSAAATLCALLAAVGFIAYGALTRQQLDVLRKAVTVCLECIGIG